MTDAEVAKLKAEFTALQAKNAAMRALLAEALEGIEDGSAYRTGSPWDHDLSRRIRALLGTAEVE